MIQFIFWLFIFYACLQLVYYLGVCTPFAFAKTCQVRKEKSTKFVSVIIAARNEQANLSRLLKSLANQDYLQFEVVLVNDRSTDSSTAILTTAEKQYNWLKVLNVEKVPREYNPKKYALQLAIQQARGEILLFTDADCWTASNKWISSMVAAYDEKTEIVLGFSDYTQENTLLNKLIRWETFYTAVQYFTLAYIGLPYMGVGRNLSYKKALFNKSRGFKGITGITGGDDDLLIGKMATKKNTALAYSVESQTFSIPPNTWRAWIAQKRRHLSVGLYYPLKIKLVLGSVQLSLIIYYLSLFVLLIVAHKIVIVATVYLFRTLATWAVLNRIAYKIYGKSKISSLMLLMPIFELFYVAYYTAVSTVVLINRKVKWK